MNLHFVFASFLYVLTRGEEYVPSYIKQNYQSFDSPNQGSPSGVKTAGQGGYGGSPSGPGGYGGSPSEQGGYGGTKTPGVKTGYYGTDNSGTNASPFNSNNQGVYQGGCPYPPTRPRNVQMKCSLYSGCKASCTPGYTFPSGQMQLVVTCQNGEWQIEKTEWSVIPPCMPICYPQCQNNGICVAPDQCNCPENFSGAYCQYESKVCRNPPPLPFNSRRVCSENKCTITCMQGYTFPDGSQVTNMMCKNGAWAPARTDWKTIPDCKATCTPSCQNGGFCLGFNMCQCPYNFRGPRCEYSIDNCKPSKLNFNGGYNCSEEDGSYHCSLICPEGVPFQFIPAPRYSCAFSEGKFLPEPIPQCAYSGEVIDPEPIVTLHPHLTESPLEELKDPKKGTCFTWGGSHYKTFDGKVFSFTSSCAHTLVRDAVDNIFSIVVQNSAGCYKNLQNCHKIIKMFHHDKEYILKRSAQDVPVFTTNEKVLTIPGRVPGIRVEMSAHYIVVLFDTVGMKIKWDGKKMVQVEASETLWKRTEGLCGKMDGNPDNDMLTKEKKKPKSVVTLASSWQVDSLEEESCEDPPSEEHTCPDSQVKGSKSLLAMQFCKKLLSDTRFQACQEAVDLNVFLDACRWDYCSCHQSDPQECPCETLNVYVRECTQQGIANLTDWRDESTCPMKCTGGRTYMPCGPSDGQAVCGGLTQESDGEVECEEGCYCPPGMVLHNSQCLAKAGCPCMYRGKEYPPGSNIPKECNTCICQDGQWRCTQVTCGARCSALGDPHYITFDGKRYDFMGQCSYYLVKHANFTIEAENMACTGAISQAMNFPISVSSGLPSCTKTVTVKIAGQTIKLKQNHEVSVNGKDLEEIPFSSPQANIRIVSSLFIVVELPNKVEVWWDGLTRVYVDVPASFVGQTQGLCGTFNSNQKDDFLTPQGDVEHTAPAFANKWKTSEKCNDIPDNLKSHPCETNVQNKETAEKHCAVIKSDMFFDCHTEVDPEQFYQDCRYDVCSCEIKLSKCLCPMVAAYAAECAMKGIKIDWRNHVRECGVHCPGGQKYHICGNSCTRSCRDVATKPECTPQCVEGCNCPEGETLDENGECIPIGQCGCIYEGLDFPAGYKEVRPASKAPELCTCVNAQWNCRPATPGELMEYPKASDLRGKCSAANNMEFTTCEPVEPVTCKNMHSDDLFTTAVCHAGCECKKGYVLDTSTKKCVKPTECPCHHGGRSYAENAKIETDCNSCTCQHGQWQCTNTSCPAECTAWGDSHYKTFDGKIFDYEGQCDYILAKGVSENDQPFDVATQNVPCGSQGVTCSKSVTIRVGRAPHQESVTLTRDKKVPENSTLAQLTLRQLDHFVIVEAPGMGVTLLWDRGTTVYVKLTTAWKGRVKGLCGNYNDNEMDDFQTPSGGVVEVSPLIFGDSWRLQPYCAEAIEIYDTCEKRPERKDWSIQSCSILKSRIFERCHGEVPVEPYLDRCIFDTCACDQGGDCECLCTAVAAYAQECNNKGVTVKWRNRDFCPMQCDEHCSSYSPCVSTCPVETCDNMLTINRITKTCQDDVCVEGCQMKPCPPNFVHLNSSFAECVPRNVCKPRCLEINGVTYYEGQLIEEDECHSCHCSRGEKVCQGTTCAPDIEPVRCVSGWTAWINIDRPVPAKKGGVKRTDIEPLPSSLLMNHIQTPSRCSVEEMVEIECRTVDTNLTPAQVGMNVICDLESGLICTAPKGGRPCPDFEIRVKCDCTPSGPCDITKPYAEHPDDCYKFLQCVPQMDGNATYVEKTCGPDMMYNPKTITCDFPREVVRIKPICSSGIPETNGTGVTKAPDCPSGKEYSYCAIQCSRLCLHYAYVVKQNGYCQNHEICSEGCVSKESQSFCPSGLFWASSHNCIPKKDCMCVSHTGKPVKPGDQVQESECEICQCIDNYYSCSNKCGATKRPTVVTPIYTQTVTSEPLPTGSSLHYCKENEFSHLIDGKKPLSNDAFSGSSILSENHLPKYARFSSKINITSSAVWSPNIENQNQYLQVNLGRPETIYGVIVQGSPMYDTYVTSYTVLYSTDGVTYTHITQPNNKPTVFRGSVDATSPIQQLFEKPVKAQIVRINPQTWHNAIALKVELIGCTSDEPPTEGGGIPPTHLCVDPMGVDNGLLSSGQIYVSSERVPQHTKQQLKLSSHFAWQPITNSPTEWIKFDFLEPRNLTGFVVKGGPDGWVTAFNVKYSVDDKTWTFVLDDKLQEMLFLGNVDEQASKVVGFPRPIRAQLFVIVPVKWHQHIQMRVEPHGCFIPYPTFEPETEPPFTACNICPDLGSEMELDACHCKDELWWDGKACVAREQCPCVIGHVQYPVSSTFKTEDCSQCICKLGGVSHCTPKTCSGCKEDLRAVVTSNCECACEACKEGDVLCPTSNVCINSTSWCDGVQDCADDEIHCYMTAPPPLVTAPPLIIVPPTQVPIECPKAICPSGYKVTYKQSGGNGHQEVISTLFTSPNKKGSTKSAFSSGGIRDDRKISIPSVDVEPIVIPGEKTEVCPQYQCVPDSERETCAVVECPPGYTPEVDVYQKAKETCPSFDCTFTPEVDAVCRVIGRTFVTFDETEFKYDICYHILARDMIQDDWEVLLKQTCQEVCSRNAVIYHGDHVITLYPDMTIGYDNYKYTVEQTKKIGSQSHLFSIYRTGDELVFVSNIYGFWVIWDGQGNVQVGVSRQLLGKVDGLCGYFTDNPSDDKRKPDGSIGTTTQAFGDSWALEKDDPSCKEKTCPQSVQNKAWEMCNVISAKAFAPCHTVSNVNSFVSHCLETACSCLQAANTTEATEKCRCSILQSYVDECFAQDSNLECTDWRVQHDCPVACKAPLVHYDCYRRRCEPSCGALQNANACPKLPNFCFHGCYCPDGYVRKGEECVLPTSCGDCECNVLPHLEYVTYDEKNFTVNGNCVYVMSRDRLVKNHPEHRFQVLITNIDCQDKAGKMCVGKVTILYKDHNIHVVKDMVNNKLRLIVDSETVTNFTDVSKWADVTEAAAKHLKLFLKEIQVKVSVYYPSLGVSVKAPSLKFGGQLEGLCGDCNGNDRNDLQMPNGQLADDVEQFGASWLFEGLPEGAQSKEQCKSQPIEECEPVPVETDPCVQLEDVSKYGQCHPVLSPNLFLDWCKKDTCNGHPELACASIETYSRECGLLGFCVDWRTKFCPAKTCPPGQKYQPCAPACSQTCKAVLHPEDDACTNPPVEGCFCPEGKVLLNQTCVAKERCETCDDEGHRPGDYWSTDACTTCSCEGLTVKCETQKCPSTETVCDPGFNAIKVPSEECCPKFICVPAPTVPTTCDPPEHIECSPGQERILMEKPDGCKEFVCHCKPRDACDHIDTTATPSKPGFVRKVDDSGCCPVIVEECVRDLCPAPLICPQLYTLKEYPVPKGACCPEYSCEAPKGVCIVDLLYTAAEQGGERPRNDFEMQRVIKKVNETWEDGPCRECQCHVTNSSYYTSCTLSMCPALSELTDHEDYILEPQTEVGKCCPSVKRVACKHKGQSYQVGEEWPVAGNPCITIECVKEGKDSVQKSMFVESCVTECDDGYELVPPVPGSNVCCGVCKPAACVVEDLIYGVGEHWTSDDFCVNYFCKNRTGCIQVESVHVTCNELKEDVIKDYVVQSEYVPNECCMKHAITACKEGHKEYMVGETWPSPDGNKCKTFTCTKNAVGEVVKESSLEFCNTTCAPGWKYVPSNKECCGQCVQESCPVGNDLKQPGAVWQSPDGCTKYICDRLGNQFTVISQEESCPDVKDCPPKNIYKKGCCQHCNQTSESLTTCNVIQVPPLQTIGVVEIIRPPYGRCVNKGVIDGYTKCGGSCSSSTAYNAITGQHDVACSCCQANGLGVVMVEFQCDTGYTFRKTITVPSNCLCKEGCGKSAQSTDCSGGTKTGVKTTNTQSGVKTG